MKRKLLWPIILSIIISFLSIAIIFHYYQKWEAESIKIDNKMAVLVKEEENKEDKDLKTIIHESQKFVVQIEAEGESGQNIGSGFIYNDKGDIITNAHVVENADSIFVKTSDAKTYPAALIGIGKDKDIAVVRVPQLINRNALPVNTEYEAEIGDDIIAVGSPLGFQNTVTIGIISGKNRTFSVSEGYEYEDAYQISAPITNGNSGGPLIHRQTGNIIAINSAGTKEGTIGFSIPVSKVMDLVQMWSDQADNEELDFDGNIARIDSTNPTELKQDASYIVNYFYESLEMRDYFNAYALLGSQWQADKTYQEFREDYIHIIDIKIRNVEAKIIENNRIRITLNSDHIVRKEENATLTEHFQVEFIVGYENDQLKIIEGERNLMSTTEQDVQE
ncbi:hypothetical protein HNQ94_003321 [Salirhabdus euzebyi]|uniref:Serine protease n=1 Tax=Salirhabdus euzebyi TaxID=394506 RepID=A0A841Q9A3_9BACI|nr:trypsin-like peptidase domain-containing protein [Salirhabdus euzebyi]MBB6454832.1 hypothetical protein [Salirhabdus euzebyi]